MTLGRMPYQTATSLDVYYRSASVLTTRRQHHMDGSRNMIDSDNASPCHCLPRSTAGGSAGSCLFTWLHHGHLQIMNAPRSFEQIDFYFSHPGSVWPSVAWHQSSSLKVSVSFMGRPPQLTLWCQPMFLISKQPTTLVWFAGWCLRTERGDKTYHVPRGDIIQICVSVKNK